MVESGSRGPGHPDPDEKFDQHGMTQEIHRVHHLEAFESKCTDDENYDIYCSVRADVGADWEELLDQECGLDFEYSKTDLQAIIFADRHIDGHVDIDEVLQNPTSTSPRSPEVKEYIKSVEGYTSGPTTQETKGVTTAAIESVSIKPEFNFCFNSRPSRIKALSPPLRIQNHITAPETSVIEPEKLQEVEKVDKSKIEVAKVTVGVGSQPSGQALPLGWYSRTNPRKASFSARNDLSNAEDREPRHSFIIHHAGFHPGRGKKLSMSNHGKKRVSNSTKDSKIPKQTIHPQGATLRVYRPTIGGDHITSISSTEAATKSSSTSEQLTHLGDKFKRPSKIGNLKFIPHSSPVAGNERLTGDLKIDTAQRNTRGEMLFRNSGAHHQPVLITPGILDQVQTLDPVSFLLRLTDELENLNERLVAQLY